MSPLPLDAQLSAVFDNVRRRRDGQVASYIPALAEADPDLFGVSLVTVDAGSYDIGDSHHPFTIQSVSKPFSFGLALDEHGLDATLESVGVEPSGDPFNAIELDLRTHRPYNPMVNTGAIVTTSLVRGSNEVERTESIVRGLSRFAGRRLEIDEDVFASERETGDRNFAIGYLLRNFGMLDADVNDVVETYFRQCSVVVTAHDLAVMGATLANGGINPVTGQRALREEHVSRVLSVMSTCGMYDYAGEWVFRIGLPAKSGVSGAVVAVLPGEFGLAVFSPPLDEHGNSVRGIAFAEEFSQRFRIHLMGRPPTARRVVRRTYRGDAVRSKRGRTAPENAVLREHGGGTHVIEVQGDLGFGATEALSRAVQEELDGATRLVIDLRRSGTIEPAMGAMFRAMSGMVESAGVELILAGLPQTLRGRVPAHEFVDVDSALEWCEDQVLSDAGLPDEVILGLDEIELLAGLGAETLERIENVAELIVLEPGDPAFREGDPAEHIYFVRSGLVDVLLSNHERAKRVSSVGPGSVFGEIGALEGGLRSGTCIAKSKTECTVLRWDELRAICAQDPAVLDRLYTNLAMTLADRLRKADDERRALW
ncbi:MAG TPA: glutaminase A [Nocardioides sp.]|uniref:glutaminase A n=1 Tax=uncultured Nocardioides sp. TaxID=198441 RepID=UPI0026340ED4|nr:glutaminase A [uncultured Nocardioides sp.]HRD59557.1 glutaminase A [Nocardioides sp.]HRI94750.1 glutaminase A [Nocardioides sp.]HRK45182.1 glutaminase A [Nocardioides sp.]